MDTLKALYFFLDRDCIDQMAFVIASQLNVLPIELNKKIVRLLCECILPYSLSDTSLTGLSIPAVLMLILQHSQDPSIINFYFFNYKILFVIVFRFTYNDC